MMKSDDTEAILKDVNTAISTQVAQQLPKAFDSLAEHYSFRAKISFDKGSYPAAMDDLKTAIMQKIDNADKIFGSGGVEPDTVSPNICTWSLTDLDTLVKRFPNDYRAFLFRGLYLEFFTSFNEKYFEQAKRDFQKAAMLNPKEPLPYFFIGDLYSKASIWTKAAQSDEGRDELIRKAILAYTTTLQSDPGFRAAYEMRAGAYLELKQYREAIRDYDQVLQLDPENITAYADRGLAKLELGQYVGTTFDLGEAIRRKSPDNSTLSNSFNLRADAYIKLGDYRHAIADFSSAIERQLATQSFLLSLRQFRDLYPEYNGVSDEVLIRKINALFWPEFGYDVIAKRLLEENGKWAIGLLNELYEKRGDAYLRSGDFRRGDDATFDICGAEFAETPMDGVELTFKGTTPKLTMLPKGKNES